MSIKKKRSRTDKSFFAQFKPFGEQQNLFYILIISYQQTKVN